MADNQPNAGAGNEAPAQQFALQRIYVKDLSFESPVGAGVFTQEWKPQIKLDMNTNSSKLEGDNFEVVLTLTITAELDGKPAFLVEVQQAGIFLVRGLEGQQLRHVLGAVAPNILFPYARETVDQLVLKGSFPPLMLAPVNFEALYQQALAQQAQQQETVQ